ncbi:MAG: hypothetical protein FKY71_12455 [Spiribacter salinus]|uniref:Type II CBASS E2 protein domain-containing protein n=1 Tax=Spiribacter salinus TaxID=1335746 RepID=A0A540VRB2_9GAMM|nr:MAG: hypothetical protein FKY71_12455 [Spiribacter salinus]
MARWWPGFRVIEKVNKRIVWQGELAPLQQRYEVSIAYGLPRHPSLRQCVHDSIHGVAEFDRCRVFPVVRVLRPALTLRPDARQEAPLPHVFPEPECPHLSALCLFDPRRGEWNHDDLIAETTIPWTVDWLVCYEGWLATGSWYGGGRPVTTVLEHG